MKKPPTRTQTARSSGRHRLRNPLPVQEYLEQLAARATFEGYSKHKRDPFRFGLAPFTGRKGDYTTCDADAGFEPGEMAAVPTWLRSGIRAGLIGEVDEGSDPKILWAVGSKGWIFEGNITIPGRAIYHGYPVLQTEAIAIDVLQRYSQWIEINALDELRPLIDACRERYGR